MSSVSLFHWLTRVQAPCLAPCWGQKQGQRCWRQCSQGKGSSRRGPAVAGTQQISPSHLSLSQWCHPPYLSPSFQGQAKLFLLTAQCTGWAPLIMMTTLAIYLPASWRLESPPPSPLPDPSLPRTLLLPAALGVGDGLGFQPSSRHTLTLWWWQGRGDGEHRHHRTVQVLWCLLVTSDGTSLKAFTHGC